MKTHITLMLGLVCVAVALAAPVAQAHPRDLIAVWYGQYLRRPVDRCGFDHWTSVMRVDGPVAVQAGILGSNEYFITRGRCQTAFIAGLYRDVLGRAPCAAEINPWLVELRRCGCRATLARSFLIAAQPELGVRDRFTGPRYPRWGR